MSSEHTCRPDPIARTRSSGRGRRQSSRSSFFFFYYYSRSVRSRVSHTRLPRPIDAIYFGIPSVGSAGARAVLPDPRPTNGRPHTTPLPPSTRSRDPGPAVVFAASESVRLGSVSRPGGPEYRKCCASSPAGPVRPRIHSSRCARDGRPMPGTSEDDGQVG